VSLFKGARIEVTADIDGITPALTDSRRHHVKNSLGASIIILLTAAFAFAGSQGQPAGPQQGGTDWRERMQKNHNAEQSIEQQVRRLTKDLELTPAQQAKVRELSKEHNAKIQKILDTAPPTLTREAFTAQVHAISGEYHDAVNAILTPHQLELMKAMLGRLDNGQERRRPRG
jgi:Spy/CpxP family protein refolding chaperone